jgi:hypothetical protein
MTRKDYILLADALRKAVDRAPTPEEKNGVIFAVAHVLGALETANSNFDVVKFYKAVYK